jgi:hypothetical protein
VGQYCPLQTTTPIDCAAGTYRSSTGAKQQTDCSACPTGNYCPEKSITPTNCPAGTYRTSLGGQSLADCLPCPPGFFCPVQSTTPTPCAAGSYRAIEGGIAQLSCTVCPVGSYCPIQTIVPIQCSAGTYRVATGATELANCLLCQPGTYSLQVGRSSNCPLCPADFYCRTSTSKDVCPLHTTSSAGSYSRVNCLCDPGYECTYYKEIQAIVTLNATAWDFANDVNGVRTAFIAAMAAAAGVQPSQVTINEVITNSRRRHLLSLKSKESIIDVHASVAGSVHLRDLDKHLNRQVENLHLSHTWKQAPQVRAVPIAAPHPPRKPQISTVVHADIKASTPVTESHAASSKASIKAKAKAKIELVNHKLLMEALKQI